LRSIERPRYLAPAIILFSLAAFLLLCLKPVHWYYSRPQLEKKAAIAEEIGNKINHAPRTVVLADHYGKWLTYHGWFGGRAWPQEPDFRMERIQGKPSLDAKTRFATFYAPDNPSYFVVTDMDALDRQPDLKSFLKNNFLTSAATSEYVIFKWAGHAQGKRPEHNDK